VEIFPIDAVHVHGTFLYKFRYCLCLPLWGCPSQIIISTKRRRSQLAHQGVQDARMAFLVIATDMFSMAAHRLGHCGNSCLKSLMNRGDGAIDSDTTWIARNITNCNRNDLKVEQLVY
jgi:hypothetical protein